MRGKIVDFEGIDGTGKSTQARLLTNYLVKNKKRHSFYKFPQYQATFHGKTVARFLKGEFGAINEVSPYLISLAYGLDRVTAKEAILDDLNEARLVVCDRYVPASKAHQAAKLPEPKRRAFLKWLDELEYKVNRMPREDLVILLDMTVETAADRLEKISRKKDIHESDRVYLAETRKVYLRLSRADWRHWIVINCDDESGRFKSRQRIHNEIVEKLKQRKFI